MTSRRLVQYWNQNTGTTLCYYYSTVVLLWKSMETNSLPHTDIWNSHLPKPNTWRLYTSTYSNHVVSWMCYWIAGTTRLLSIALAKSGESSSLRRQGRMPEPIASRRLLPIRSLSILMLDDALVPLLYELVAMLRLYHWNGWRNLSHLDQSISNDHLPSHVLWFLCTYYTPTVATSYYLISTIAIIQNIEKEALVESAERGLVVGLIVLVTPELIERGERVIVVA